MNIASWTHRRCKHQARNTVTASLIIIYSTCCWSPASASKQAGLESTAIPPASGQTVDRFGRRQTARQPARRTDGRTDGQTDRQTDGRTDKTDGQPASQTKRKKPFFPLANLNAYFSGQPASHPSRPDQSAPAKHADTWGIFPLIPHPPHPPTHPPPSLPLLLLLLLATCCCCSCPAALIPE